jgi:hypothetical protein
MPSPTVFGAKACNFIYKHFNNGSVYFHEHWYVGPTGNVWQVLQDLQLYPAKHQMARQRTAFKETQLSIIILPMAIIVESNMYLTTQ